MCHRYMYFVYVHVYTHTCTVCYIHVNAHECMYIIHVCVQLFSGIVALCCLVSRTDRFMYAKLEFSLLIRW